MPSGLKNYLIEVVYSLDQTISAILGGYGDETFSARCHRLETKNQIFRIMRPVVDTLFFFQPMHCYNAYLNEKSRKDLPPEYRV